MSDDQNPERTSDLREYIHRFRDHPTDPPQGMVANALRLLSIVARGQITEHEAARQFDPDDPAVFSRITTQNVTARHVLRADGHPNDALTLAWQMQRDAIERRARPTHPRLHYLGRRATRPCSCTAATCRAGLLARRVRPLGGRSGQ